MTDTGPATPVDDIVVRGQRRRPGGVFPSRTSPGGGVGDDGGAQQDEFADREGELAVSSPDPCASPDTALPWNADAAAAASVAAFLQAAGGLGGSDAPGGVPNLSQREFGRALFRTPGGGVSGNAVSWGGPPDPDGVSSIYIDVTGITPVNYVGDAHSHPNGNPLPSQADWNGFMQQNAQARDAGRVNDTFYLYIVTVGPNGRPSAIYVYQDGPRAANSSNPARPTAVGPEVNPDAQPCP